MVKVREIEAKSILNPSKIHDYCLNPFTGCELNCAYCYARLFMRRYSGHAEPWGEFVDVKVNAPELLRRQLQRAKRGTVWISSVCDPYQPLESRYRLTRRCLKELAERNFPVVVQTKSALAVRDLDVFLRFEEIEVGFTIPTDDEETSRLFEPKASPLRDRLDGLEKIHRAGIRTFAFIGPILPGRPERLVDMLRDRVDSVLIDRMNYVSTLSGFYRRRSLEAAASDSFFLEMKALFVRELEKRGMDYEVFF